MKTRKMLLLVGLLIMTTTVFAQKKKTEEFKVYGNCGMCETRIEKAVDAVPGVMKSAWDSETEMLTVTYKIKDAKVMDIHNAVAKVGHDTDKARAKDEVYAKLHGCCKYERPAAKKK